MLHTYRVRADRVLRVDVAQSGKHGIPFLDWEIRAQKKAARDELGVSFSGSGVYGVCFRGRVVYVGKYLGKKPKDGDPRGAYNAGDVVTRWWAHFGSLVARSHRLHVAPEVLQALLVDVGAHPLLTSLSQAVPAIHIGNGCLGAENRLRFAMRNWERFTTTAELRLLRQFSFLYVREDGAGLCSSPRQLAEAIEAAEIEAIALLQPEGNTAGRHHAAEAARIAPREVLQVLEAILHSRLKGLRV